MATVTDAATMPHAGVANTALSRCTPSLCQLFGCSFNQIVSLRVYGELDNIILRHP